MSVAHSSYRKIARFSTLFVLVLLIILSSGYSGFLLGQGRLGVSSRFPAYIRNAISPTEQAKDIDFKLFWQAWNVIDKNFYGDTNSEKRVQGAIAGMVAGLKDPYTVYFEPSDSALFKTDLEGSFGGIGAELTVRDGLITVVASLEGTPSDKAGLKAQDIILKIDDKKANDFSFNDAINKIRGPKGSTVKLQVARKNVEKPFDISVVRDTITVKSVKTDSVGPDKTIGYLKINQFGSDTTALVKAALEDFKKNSKKSLIIDLRNNPGGYLVSAAQIIGMLIPEKSTSTEEALKNRVAVIERHKDGKEETERATTSPILDTLPIVILTNGGSASASEIMAGALKDYKRATLLGTKTFGKGSVQTLQDLENGGSIKVTIAKWFTPLGNGIDGKGIEPDITLELPEKSELSTTDAQVQKAIEVLTSAQPK